MHGVPFEEFGWKQNVHAASTATENDRAATYAALIDDDGFSLGVLFRDHLLPRSTPCLSGTSLAEIEAEFSVCG